MKQSHISYWPMLKRYLLFVLVWPGVLYGQQQRTITGTVSDDTGPLPGVTVTVKGTQEATFTNDQGAF